MLTEMTAVPRARSGTSTIGIGDEGETTYGHQWKATKHFVITTCSMHAPPLSLARSLDGWDPGRPSAGG